jgi:hypothetical protein
MAIPFLKKKPSIGVKALQEALQDKYSIDINYQTVVYGKQRACDKLFSKWDDSFDWLYRFKAEVEMRSPGSILEIYTATVDDNVYFKRFFCCFKAQIDGFRNGCRPYISIDSTTLNGLWNGHLPAAQRRRRLQRESSLQQRTSLVPPTKKMTPKKKLLTTKKKKTPAKNGKK